MIKRQPRRKTAPTYLASALVVMLSAVACSNGDDAGEAIVSQEPSATATPLTLGIPPTPTVVVSISTDGGTSTAISTTTAGLDTSAGPTPAVAAPTTSIVLADTAFTNSSKVTTVGLDEVFFGMDPNDAAEAASTSWIGMPESETWPNCFVVSPSNGPEGVSFWVFNRAVERVNVSHPSIRTRSGYGVGTQLAELQQALGAQLEVTDFADGTQTAVFVPSDPTDAGYRLIFELRDGQVFRFRSGRVGVVELPDTSCA